MLQRIRDNSNGPMAYIIVGLISLVFGVWGIGSYFTPSADPVVASVGQSDITRYQLQNAYDQQYRQLRQQLGQDFDASQIKPERFRRAVLENLIQDAVIDQYAKKSGYRVTNGNILAALQSTPVFQKDGHFSAQKYKNVLANAGLTPETYEAQLRRDMLSAQVGAALTNTAFVTPPTLKHTYQLQHEKRDVALLVFPIDQLAKTIKPTEEQIKHWYDKNGDQFTTPEQVKLNYVTLSQDDVNTDFSQDELKAAYNENKSQFSSPAAADFVQVFVSNKSGEDVVSQVKKAINKDADLHDLGIDKARVINRHNVERADLPAPIAQALFSLAPGEVSKTIETNSGWYWVKPTHIQQAQTQAFDSPEVQQKLKAQLRAKRFEKRSDQLEKLAFQAPNDLDALVDELGLKVHTSGWISRESGDGIGKSKAVRKAAFSQDVLEDGFNSEPIILDDAHQVVIRVEDHKASKRRPLKEVKNKVVKKLKSKLAQQQALDAASKALKQIHGGKDLDAIAKQSSSQLKELGGISRDSKNIKPRVIRSAFTLPAPDKYPSAEVITLDKDHAAVVAVKSIHSVAVKDQDIPTRLKQTQQQYNAMVEREAFVNELNDDAKIKRYTQRIDPDND